MMMRPPRTNVRDRPRTLKEVYAELLIFYKVLAAID